MTTDLNVDDLNVDERLDLIARLWDSIPVAELPIPEWHREELDRRIANADANPNAGVPWEEVRDRLRNQP